MQKRALMQAARTVQAAISAVRRLFGEALAVYAGHYKLPCPLPL